MKIYFILAGIEHFLKNPIHFLYIFIFGLIVVLTYDFINYLIKKYR